MIAVVWTVIAVVVIVLLAASFWPFSTRVRRTRQRPPMRGPR